MWYSYDAGRRDRASQVTVEAKPGARTRWDATRPATPLLDNPISALAGGNARLRGSEFAHHRGARQGLLEVEAKPTPATGSPTKRSARSVNSNE